MANSSQVITEQTPDKTPVDNRRKRFINLLLTADEKTPTVQLAREAGYAESYVTGNLYEIMQSESFQRQLLEAYKGATTERLPQCLRIRQKALDVMEGDPTIAIDKPKLLESTERIAGVHNEEKTRVPTINIGRLQILMQEMHSQPVKAIEQVREAEIVEG